MANITELLEVLNTKGAAVSTLDLANELKASKEGTLKQLTREKEKGNVDGNSQDGWVITDNGRKALEEGDIHPTMIEEGVTPRQQFEAIGQRIGIKGDRIILATDIVWSGDYNDVSWVWQALGQADLADDLRSVWVNAWRAKLHKAIPPELETELTGVSKAVAEAEKDTEPGDHGGRDFIIVDDEPVRVGRNLGDYSLQDAKDILALRALRLRFTGGGQPGTGLGVAAGAGGAGALPDLLNALKPYIKQDATDLDQLKEVIALQLELQKQEILSTIPAQGAPARPKSFMEQIVDFTTSLGTLKEVGPLLRSILGIPESPGGNQPAASFPVQLTGTDGKPIVMDLSNFISLEKFRGEERRSDERHKTLVGLAQTARENLSDGIAALKAAAEEARGSGKGETSSETKPQVFQCGECQQRFNAPAQWAGEPLKCPQCGHEYTKEELLG